MMKRWPELLVKNAAARWPAALRDRLQEEWLAELEHLPNMSRRLWFAASLWAGHLPKADAANPSSLDRLLLWAEAMTLVSMASLILALAVLVAKREMPITVLGVVCAFTFFHFMAWVRIKRGLPYFPRFKRRPPAASNPHL